jgi:hypothetical protein
MGLLALWVNGQLAVESLLPQAPVQGAARVADKFGRGQGAGAAGTCRAVIKLPSTEHAVYTT